jgi:hypothetical protein
MTTPREPLRPRGEPAAGILVRLMAAASLLRVGETEAGLRSLRSVVAAWPEHPLPRDRLAVVLAGSGRATEALDALDGAVTAGLAAVDELEAEPAFGHLHRDARFLAAVSAVRRNRTAGGSGGGAGP